MKTTGLQFHATRSDIYSAMAQWADGLAMTVVGETFFPAYRLTLLSSSDLQATDAHSKIDRVSLQPGAVDLEFDSSREFLEGYPNGMTVLIGQRVDNLLFESILGARTADLEALKTWRRLRNGLKRSMKKGAWVVNSMSGARWRDDGHLYTPSARELQSAGVTMVGQTDQIHYLLD